MLGHILGILLAIAAVAYLCGLAKDWWNLYNRK